MSYKETKLWTNSLGMSHDNPEINSLLERLRNSFVKARENASFLLEKIHMDFPSLTLYDIPHHVDVLWQTGSVISGDNFQISPLEGYVLGCAFLMHDAVLSYQAAGGKDKLRDTIEWRDYYADYQNHVDMTDDEKKYETDFRTIRHLHAKYAKNLYQERFTRDDHSVFYIIEDEVLRNHLGEIICNIAASHHWDFDEVERLGSQLPAPAGFPQDWRINPIKLACILRCADAAHIDSNRAPDYLLKLLDLNGISRSHWIAQNHLSQIDIDSQDNSYVIIKSEISYKEEEYAAWNVAYDAICVIDHEIKCSNILLKKYHSQEFQAKGIRGAESQHALSEYVQADGWVPCNANIHISNIEHLINNLGGEKLYGNKNKLEIAIRELVQNSRDAIVARRQLQHDYEGKIRISIKSENDKTQITITDDGIGMSLQTIKDYFLNFGSSFWASDLSKAEYPGLNSSEFESVGQFGIGFFAIFMVASDVLVETRRFDKGIEETYKIKFPNGLCLHPIISKSQGSPAFSTRVIFILDDRKCEWQNTFTVEPGVLGVANFDIPYESVIANITAGLDVNVFYSEGGNPEIKIHNNIHCLKMGSPEMAEWIKSITLSKARNDKQLLDYIDNNIHRLRKIMVDNQFCGIAALNTLWGSRKPGFDIVTVGGLTSFTCGSTDPEFLGCLISKPITAKREASKLIPYSKEWAKEQYDILCEQGLSEQDRIYLPYVLGKYDIDMTDILLIRVYCKRNRYLQGTLKDVLLYMKENNYSLVFPISNLGNYKRVEVNLDTQRTIDCLQENELLFSVEKNSNFLSIENSPYSFKFNIYNCIHSAAEKASLKLSEHWEKRKGISRIEGFCDGLVISVN